MTKTKIVCTLGPASHKTGTIQQLVDNGMSAARLNFSHGDYEAYQHYIDTVRKVDDSIPIIADLKGVEIRIVGLDEPLHIQEGQTVTLCGTDEDNCIHVSYANIHTAVDIGTTILLDDGRIRLQVIDIHNNKVICTAQNTNILQDNRKVTLRDSNVKLRFPSEQDEQDIAFAKEAGVEFIAISFVKRQRDVAQVRKYVQDSDIQLITKIETAEAVENFDDILALSDGIMVARGDLGVELPPEEVPRIQKDIIRKCNQRGVPVIVATQMLESMIDNPLPTRAETSDVANAILDGCDAIMLSGESAIGSYPAEAVSMMHRIAHETDPYVSNQVPHVEDGVSETVSHAAYEIGESICTAIIAVTVTGFSGRMISRFKPHTPLYVVTHNATVRNQLALNWNVTPLLFSTDIRHRHTATSQAVQDCHAQTHLNRTDRVVIAGGIATESGSTNLIEVHTVEELLQS